MEFSGIAKFAHNTVYMGRRELDLHLELWNHSPTGFAWGYMGSGPTQLAKSMLYEFARYSNIVNGQAFAEEHGYRFKETFIGRIPQGENWVITEENITDWLRGESITRFNALIVRFGISGT